DLEQGRLIPDEEIKAELARSHPYREWLQRTQIVLEDLPAAPSHPAISNIALLERQQTFGYTEEDLRLLMSPMAATGEEAVGSMGNGPRDRGAARKAKAHIPLLKEDLRGGDNPADRPDSRRIGHEPGVDHRPAAQPVRSRRALAHQAAGGAPADTHKR